MTFIEFLKANVDRTQGSAEIKFKKSVKDFYVVGKCELCELNGNCKKEKNILRRLGLLLKLDFVGCLDFTVDFQEKNFTDPSGKNSGNSE